MPPKSAGVLRSTVSQFKAPLYVYADKNLQVVEESDAIILAVPPDDICKVLEASGMREALRGKLLISLAAGVTQSQIEIALYGNSSTVPDIEKDIHVVRAMPNLAVSVRQSVTAIDLKDQPLPEQFVNNTEAIFKEVGSIVHVPEKSFDACVFLYGSTPVVVALFCDAMIDGAVASGVPRKTAQPIIVRILNSAAALMQNGTSPSDLRERVCAQPGCIISAIISLEKGGVRGAIASATQDGIILASGLGQNIS